MWYLIILSLIIIYLIPNMIPTNIIDSSIQTYILKPIIWTILAITIFYISKKQEINITSFKKIRKWQIGKNPTQAAILIGCFHISLLIISGIYMGFGQSPYSHTPRFLIINLFLIGSMIISFELSRAIIIKKTTKKKRNITPIIAFITVLFAFIYIPYNAFTSLNLSSNVEIIRFIGETIIPMITISLFTTYMSYIAGAKPAITYMIIIYGFEWFSPILPDLNWPLMAFIKTIVPAIGYIIIQSNIQTINIRKKISKRSKDQSMSWIIIASIGLVFVLFSTGFFGFQPTVIYSGSMNPEIEIGDIVVIKEIDVGEIKEGDIIGYIDSDLKVPIIHRVIDKNMQGEIPIFITKGDANNAPDEKPVFEQQITGKKMFTIPKIGWIPITLKQFVQNIKKSIL